MSLSFTNYLIFFSKLFMSDCKHLGKMPIPISQSPTLCLLLPVCLNNRPRPKDTHLQLHNPERNFTNPHTWEDRAIKYMAIWTKKMTVDQLINWSTNHFRAVRQFERKAGFAYTSVFILIGLVGHYLTSLKALLKPVFAFCSTFQSSASL